MLPQKLSTISPEGLLGSIGTRCHDSALRKDQKVVLGLLDGNFTKQDFFGSLGKAFP